MVFQVEISPEAFGDLDRISTYIQENASAEIAERWLMGVFNAMRSLDEMPSRGLVAEESADLKSEVRILLHGKQNRCYKIYFAIHLETSTVRIFHIRHWARKPVTTEELETLQDEASKPGNDN